MGGWSVGELELQEWRDALSGWIGDGRDDRPEDLEHWTRPQSSGFRISDVIEWAQAILALNFGDERNPPPTTLTANPERSWNWLKSTHGYQAGSSNYRFEDYAYRLRLRHPLLALGGIKSSITAATRQRTPTPLRPP